jgi:hypothetical protein
MELIIECITSAAVDMSIVVFRNVTDALSSCRSLTTYERNATYLFIYL